MVSSFSMSKRVDLARPETNYWRPYVFRGAYPLVHSKPVAPVVQLVTSKPSDVWDVSSNFGAVTRTGIFSHIMPNKQIKIM